MFRGGSNRWSNSNRLPPRQPPRSPPRRSARPVYTGLRTVSVGGRRVSTRRRFYPRRYIPPPMNVQLREDSQRIEVKVWRHEATAVLNMHFTSREKESWNTIEAAVRQRLGGTRPLNERHFSDFVVNGKYCDAKLCHVSYPYNHAWIWTSDVQMSRIANDDGFFYIVMAERNYEVWKIPGRIVRDNFFDR